jgi:hypothetical protein
LHLHPRVDLPDSSYTLMPEGRDEGADGDVHYVVVEQHLDQSPEGPKANLANEGKPQFIINPFLFILCNYLCYACAFMCQDLIWNSIAWSLGAFVLLLVY